jgi:hypothetical protein
MNSYKFNRKYFGQNLLTGCLSLALLAKINLGTLTDNHYIKTSELPVDTIDSQY